MKSIFKKVMLISLSFFAISTIFTGLTIAQTTKKPLGEIRQLPLPAATTSPTAKPNVSYGACVIRDGYTSLPGYNAADSGKGYAMKKMGTVVDYNDAKSKCIDPIYQQITSSYCATNTNPAQWEVALYDKDGNYKTTGCAQSGCNNHACPVVQYGACVIRDGYTSLPGYNAADSGKGYAMKKMGTVNDYNDIKQKCIDAVYQSLTPPYCQTNTNPAQWEVALYDKDGNFKTTGCAASGCNDHACPVVR